jgi:hypothetical protein
MSDSEGILAKSTGFVILAISILISSCTERIDIALDKNSVRLVVEGSVTTDTMSHSVVLTETSDYYYNKSAPRVTGAIVEISDGHMVFGLHEDSPGLYKTDPSFHGVAGMTYTLDIRLAEPVGGHTQYSASATLFPVSSLDSVSLDFQPEWSDNGIWVVKCYVQDPPTVDYYRFLIAKNGRMLSDSLGEWFVTDDKFFNGNYASGAPVAFLRQNREEEILNPGDIVTVEINNIGPDYAHFIWEAQSEIRGSNPLFSGPAANVKGNISNGAIGFFAAYSVSRNKSVVPDNP